MQSGRPDLDAHVIPGHDGGEFGEVAFELWRSRHWAKALKAAGVPYQRPYDLRHSFAPLLLHEGRSVIYVARQLGHSAALTMRTYGHVIDELEDAIARARERSHVRVTFASASEASRSALGAGRKVRD